MEKFLIVSFCGKTAAKRQEKGRRDGKRWRQKARKWRDKLTTNWVSVYDRAGGSISGVNV